MGAVRMSMPWSLYTLASAVYPPREAAVRSGVQGKERGREREVLLTITK